MGWISPNWHDDVDGKWNSETNAYDGNTGTSAVTDLNEVQHWLELGRYMEIFSCDKIRLYASESGYPEVDVYVDIDVYDIDASSWINVFNGLITKLTWVEKTIPGGPIRTTKARIWWDQKVGMYAQMFLYEFEFNQLPAGAARPLVNGSLAGDSLVNKGLVS